MASAGSAFEGLRTAVVSRARDVVAPPGVAAGTRYPEQSMRSIDL